MYFKWQILDWELSKAQAQEIGLELELSKKDSQIRTTEVLQTPPPSFIKNEERGKKTRQFRGRHVDFAESNAKRKNLGLSGEKFILEYEKDYLVNNGREDLAAKVTHTSQVEGDGAGYDIQSYTLNGKDKFIEVKTTSGGEKTPFILTINELAFLKNFRIIIIYIVYMILISKLIKDNFMY